MLLHLANRGSSIPPLDATNSHLAHHLTGSPGMPSLGAGRPFTATSHLAEHHLSCYGARVHFGASYSDTQHLHG